MKRKPQGRYIISSTAGEKVRAFVPAPLPPDPPLRWTPDLRAKFDQALVELGRLGGIADTLPNTALFLYMYVRKEALLSSLIEGTQSSLSDLLLYELDLQPGAPLDDVLEVSNYVAAISYGLDRLEEEFPLSLRLIREIHRVLLSRGRGSRQGPGEFRRSQNWIGGTRPGNATYVPPPHQHVQECMGQLEDFLHDRPEPTPALLKAALAHVQFETIHPFLDGNGRMGRLLITLILCEKKMIKRPLLYLSLYFKSHRQQYYDLLNRVRFLGDWEAWLDFFAEAVIYTAGQAVSTARQIIALAEGDQEKIRSLGRSAANVLRLHRAFLERPLATSGWLAERLALSPATVNRGLARLVRLGILRELTGRRRNRVFSYAKYLDIMNQGTELP